MRIKGDVVTGSNFGAGTVSGVRHRFPLLIGPITQQ
jgi:hypothetical protein